MDSDLVRSAGALAALRCRQASQGSLCGARYRRQAQRQGLSPYRISRLDIAGRRLHASFNYFANQGNRRTPKKHLLPFAACLLCVAGAARAQTVDTPAAEPGSPHTLTGNVAAVSDYRFRGVSQTYRHPAIQGGFDYTHDSGFYLGNWNSSVSANSYNNGASLEVDLYGGFRFPVAKNLGGDVGVIHYLYPGARLNSALATPTGSKYDNTEVYFGLTQGAFNARLSSAVSDYFGLNGSTAGYAYFNALPNRGNSKGTMYLDLNYNVDLGNQVILGLHAGYTSVRRYSELSYTDYKISVGKEFAGLNLNLAWVGANADSGFYQAADPGGLNPKKLAKTALVVSVGKIF